MKAGMNSAVQPFPPVRLTTSQPHGEACLAGEREFTGDHDGGTTGDADEHDEEKF